LCLLGICPAFAAANAKVTANHQTAANLPAYPAAEVQSVLMDLIRIDTSNPPGNETKAAQYIQNVLKKEGIASEIYEQVPGRGNIVARLKGTGQKRPVMLMGHLDVVGVQRDHWDTDPFVPTIKDGYLYGRGAMDDKGMVAANLVAFLELKRKHVPLDRDVIFLAEAGEEGGPQVGIDYMVANHWADIDAESCLNEGGGMVVEDGKVKYVAVSTTEKVPWPTKLVAHGHSGHASVPVPDNPILHLAAALDKIAAFEMPVHLDANAITFFHGLAKISPPAEAAVYAELDDPTRGGEAQKKLQTLNPRYAATLRTTIVPTILAGGFRENVIPATAEATLDIRVLPQDDIRDVIASLKRVINDPAVEVLPPDSARPTSGASPTSSDLFHALTAAQEQMFPKSVTLPMLLPATTDAAQLRAKGMFVYGLGGPQTTDDRSRVHGNNERIALPAIGEFSQFIYLTMEHAVTQK